VRDGRGGDPDDRYRRITILNSTSAVWEIEMNYRSGGIGIVGVIVIVLVILWLVGVIKL
jgi:hypothetical protein